MHDQRRGPRKRPREPDSATPLPLCDAAEVEPMEITYGDQIDWGPVFRAALAVSRDSGEDVALAIDNDNLGAVLRVRARHAADDLDSQGFLLKLMIAYVRRSPLSHALFWVQEQKKGQGRAGYLAKLPDFFDRLMQECEVLLSDMALASTDWWGQVFEQATRCHERPAAERANLCNVIAAGVVGNAVELWRRFKAYGCGGDAEGPWLSSSLSRLSPQATDARAAHRRQKGV